MKEKLVKIFLLPPSLKELEQRLSNRASDTKKEINFRMSKAVKEIKHYEEYDYVLVNSDLNDTFNKILKIIDTERLKIFRQTSIKKFVSNLT